VALSSTRIVRRGISTRPAGWRRHRGAVWGRY